MKIKLDVSKDKFYYEVFVLINNNFLHLKPKEVEVLAALYQKNYELSDKIPNEKLRMLVLFNKDTKDELCEKLNMGYHSFMNNITNLRKRELIVNNMINKKLVLNPHRLKIEIDVNTVV